MRDLPSELLRCFGREGHALQFISGQIRFGLLDHYRSIEGARQDEMEGRVSFYWNMKAPQFTIDSRTGRIVGQTESDQNIRYHGTSLNAFYIVSTSHPDAAKQVLAKRFGSFIVRISDPLTLLKRIKLAWRNHDWALNDGVVIAPVEYNKDGLLEPDQYLRAPPHYSYSQKPTSFIDEQEFRYVATCSIDVKRTLNDYLTLDVGDCSDICNLI